MLKKQSWMKYTAALILEWQQAKDEGRNVDDLKEICEQVSKAAKDESFEDIAQAVQHKLINAPVLP